jgi:hypothetical protein
VSVRISFVLHAPSDEGYAARLAGHIGAQPLSLEPGITSRMQFGPGVVCIVLWSDVIAAQNEALLRAVTSAVVVVVRKAGSALPGDWATFDFIDAGTPADDARAIASLVNKPDAVIFEAPRLLGAASPPQRLAMRSTYGMAATLAVASLVTPFIMERAQATDAGGMQPPSAPGQGAGLLRASLAALASEEAIEPAVTPTPALDRWLAPVDEGHAAPMLVAYTRDAEPLEFTEQGVVNLLDPKREAFTASTIATDGAEYGFGFAPPSSAKAL